MIGLAGFTFILAPALRAQTLATTASLSGSIEDPQAAMVADAKVTLTSADRGITRTFTTEAPGAFSFALLPAATYTLTVEARGFAAYKQEGILLEVGQSVSQNIKLSLAGTAEHMEVVAQMASLNINDANISTEISGKQVQELPLNLRNVFGLLTLNSSVQSVVASQTISGHGQQGTADQDISFLSFGGGFFGSTAFMLDGGWDTGNNWGGVIYVPSVEDVQEFKVQSNSFTAQYGWSTGNVVNVITKSGTNSFHGSAYEFLRNDMFDANHYFNNLNGIPRPPRHRHQFGASGGGPVLIPGVYHGRNKTFFFANYEALRLNDTSSDHQIVPTAAFLAGNFSSLLGANIGTDALGRPVLAGQIYNPYTTRQVVATSGPQTGQTVTIRDPYPGNIIPSSGVGGIDSLANKFATGNYWPGPTNPNAQTNFNVVGSNPTQSNEYNVRVDQNFGDNTRIYGRWSWKHEFKGATPTFYGANNVGGPGVVNPNNRYSFALGGSHVFSPSFVMSLNSTFVRWVEGNHTQSFGFKSSTLGLPVAIDTLSPQFPQLAFPNHDFAPLGGRDNFGELAVPNIAGTISIDFSKSSGKHALSFGYMGVLSQVFGGRISPTAFSFTPNMTSGPDPTAPAATTGNSFASFMAGAGTGGFTGINAFSAPTKYLHGVYLQDDWKVARKLTLNLGFRYEVQTPEKERSNKQAYFDYNALNPISVVAGIPVNGEVVYSTPGHRNLYNPNWTDFAPRVGFAYQAMSKLVVRGGFGFFYAQNLYGGGPNPGYSQSTPWDATNDGIHPVDSLSKAFTSTGILLPTGNGLGGLTNVGFSGGGINPDRSDPRIKQFMLGIQYAFTPNDLLDLSYVGNRGTHMILSGFNYGQLDPKYLSMGNALNTQVPNPFFGAITSSGCGLDKATVAQFQLLLPYPEFCGGDTANSQPIGNSSYNALQANFTHRITHGLTFMASYTYSKFLSDVSGSNDWASTNSNFSNGIRNYYNLAADRSVDPTDIPQSLVLNYVYELPLGRGKKYGNDLNRVVDGFVGGWQISGISSFHKGYPLSIFGSVSADGSAGLHGGSAHATVVGDPNSGTCPNGAAVKTRTCWFNPAAFAQTPAFQFGNAPRYFSNLRSPGYNNTDLALQKWFNVTERFRLQFRAEMFNAFNQTNFFGPNTSLGDSNIATISDAYAARQVQMALKLYW